MSVVPLTLPKPWKPPQLGLPRALLIALGLEAVSVVLLLSLLHHAPASEPRLSVVAAYAGTLHVLIQNNIVIGAIIQQLGLSGSVRVRFTLGPQGGHVLDARVLSGNANGLIRRVALKTVRRLGYPAFPTIFCSATRVFVVTVQIERP